MTIPAPPANLPTWNDAHSVSLFIAATASFVLGMLALFHVGVPQGVTSQVGTVSGIVGAIVALVVNVVTHRSAHTQATVAQAYAPSPEAAVTR